VPPTLCRSLTGHAAAQRHLFNRMIGQLYHCLQASELFDEHIAFPFELAAAA
jgi:hypothetical protein